MSEYSFEDYVTRERERIEKERNDCIFRKKAMDDALAELDRQMEAVNAYEAAKTGKAEAPKAEPKKQRRFKRGELRSTILNAIRDSATGMSRGQLLDFFGVRGQSSGEGSVSSALNALKKTGELVHVGKVYQLNPEIRRAEDEVEAEMRPEANPTEAAEVSHWNRYHAAQ